MKFKIILIAISFLCAYQPAYASFSGNFSNSTGGNDEFDNVGWLIISGIYGPLLAGVAFYCLRCCGAICDSNSQAEQIARSETTDTEELDLNDIVAPAASVPANEAENSTIRAEQATQLPVAQPEAISAAELKPNGYAQLNEN